MAHPRAVIVAALSFVLTATVSPAATRRVPVLIELQQEAAADSYARVVRQGGAGSLLAKWGSIVAAADAAASDQLSVILDEQDRFASRLRDSGIDTKPIYRVQRVINGVAVAVDPSQIEALGKLPGVKSVTPIEPEYITASNSVPFMKVPVVWQMMAGANRVDGTGLRIGIIDTGVDYLHAHFGGNGDLASYQANDRTSITDSFFPTARVVGGRDFAGDAYDGESETAVPDDDPMDCNGHGTHVAGIAAGNGVKDDGTPFTGPYDATTPFSSLRIHPGVAPKAQLYALRVFGCGGSTGLTVPAIEWAVDPNKDGNLSDHLDVINMSLGSSFGTLAATTAMATDKAAAAGVVVVASAGNAGDTFFITGSPGSDDRVISTAATIDDGFVATALRVNSPPAIAGFFPNTIATFGGGVSPAGLTGRVVLALDPADAAGAATIDGCSPFTNAPAVAGNIALIERGTCTFVVKIKNAQNAGAVGVIVFSNSAAAPGNMGGSDSSITIPAVMVSAADGQKFREHSADLNVTLFSGGDNIASFSSRGPRGGPRASMKPDVAAPGLGITSAQTGTTCTDAATGCQVSHSSGFLAGNQVLVISGTSMATPQIAGIAALVRQVHPDWTAEEVKAAIMNGAAHDVIQLRESVTKQATTRAGAGRTDPVASVQNTTLAYDAENPGVVSVSFVEDFNSNTTTRSRNVRVANKSNAAVTHDLSIVTTLDAPGVGFSLPGGSTITLAPLETKTISVALSIDVSAMDHVRDPSLATTFAAPSNLGSLGALNRSWVAEESALLVFRGGGTEKLRLPLYALARPASQLAAAGAVKTGGVARGSTNIGFTGTGLCTGVATGSVCSGSFPTDRVSLVSPFELQVTSARDPNKAASRDLQYAGVAYDAANDLILFGLATHGSWFSPTDVAFNVYVDTNEDGTWDRIVFNSNPGTIATSLYKSSTSAQDVFINGVATVATKEYAFGGRGLYTNADPALIDNAIMRNNTIVLAASPAQLGLAAGDTSFHYKVLTCPGNSPVCVLNGGSAIDSEAGPFRWDYAKWGLDFGGRKLTPALPGSSLPVSWNMPNFRTNGSLGMLLLHHHNAEGTRAEVVAIDEITQVTPPKRRRSGR